MEPFACLQCQQQWWLVRFVKLELEGFFVELVDVVDSGICHGGLEFVDNDGYVEVAEVFLRQRGSLYGACGVEDINAFSRLWVDRKV
jgi:hypothetical protein